MHPRSSTFHNFEPVKQVGGFGGENIKMTPFHSGVDDPASVCTDQHGVTHSALTPGFDYVFMSVSRSWTSFFQENSPKRKILYIQ